MRFLMFAAVTSCLASSAAAAPAIPYMEDANQRCVEANFQRTMAFLDHGSKLREKIQAELEKPVPDWPKLRSLVIGLRQNDILFRKEMYRVELKCLDQVSAQDRITSLKTEFRGALPPPIKVEQPH
jgi:hypothetical protein